MLETLVINWNKQYKNNNERNRTKTRYTCSDFNVKSYITAGETPLDQSIITR